jgi:hypothetical protein
VDERSKISKEVRRGSEQMSGEKRMQRRLERKSEEKKTEDGVEEERIVIGEEQK